MITRVIDERDDDAVSDDGYGDAVGGAHQWIFGGRVSAVAEPDRDVQFAAAGDVRRDVSRTSGSDDPGVAQSRGGTALVMAGVFYPGVARVPAGARRPAPDLGGGYVGSAAAADCGDLRGEREREYDGLCRRHDKTGGA